MKKIELVYLVILLFGLVAVFELNILAGGTITSPQHLAEDLVSPPNSPQDWVIQDWATVKYRALFRLIVRGTWSVFFAPTDALNFYRIFVLWSFIFFFSALIAFYFYLRELDFDRRTSFVGGLLFLASPPVLLAYKFPVYTREDPLAYLLVILGLIAIFKSKAVWVSALSVAAALTRETALVVPLVYVLTNNESWQKKLLVCVPPAFALVGIRILWGFVAGNNFDSSLLNFQTPAETLAFLFCVFGALWLPYVTQLWTRWRAGDFSSSAWRMLTHAGPIILVGMLGATLVLARATEIRIAFILFPWAIPFALDWFRSNNAYLKRLVSDYHYWAFVFSTFLFISGLVLFFQLTNPSLLRDYLVNFKNGYWLVISALHLSITLAIFLPMLHQPLAQTN